MSSPVPGSGTGVKKHVPFVPENMEMKEFTLRAVLLGLSHDDRAGRGQRLPGIARRDHDRGDLSGRGDCDGGDAGVEGIAARRKHRSYRGLDRRVGRGGRNFHAFPHFCIAKAWPSFRPADAYWKSTALIMVGSILGVLFISLVRRVMVEDPELPFPESVAASEIHKAGQRGARGREISFLEYRRWRRGVHAGTLWIVRRRQRSSLWRRQSGPQPGPARHAQEARTSLATGGTSMFAAPSVSPAYLGVGYIIGLRLASIQFAGGVLAWGLMVPLLMFFLGPQLKAVSSGGYSRQLGDHGGRGVAIHRASHRRRRNAGGRGLHSVQNAQEPDGGTWARHSPICARPPTSRPSLSRTEHYMSSKIVFGLIAVMFVLMCFLYIHISGLFWPAILAAVVMLVVGFFFATVSGNLVGFIGSSNNPISGLTLSTLLIAALLMVSLGVSGTSGVAAVLGVAAVVCVSSAVAGELLQDFKVGYILGGTPARFRLRN